MSDDNGPAGCPDAPAVKASGVETSSRGGRLQPGLSHLNKTGGAAADELSRRCALLHQRRTGHIRIRIDQQMLLLRDRLVLEPELARQARTLHRHEESSRGGNRRELSPRTWVYDGFPGQRVVRS